MSQQRRSGGGTVVDQGLAAVGYRPGRGEVLIETTPPRARPWRMVLAQNAWNFVPRDQFDDLVSRYPYRMRGRIRARRAVARVNVGRAASVVALTEHMADLVRSASGREVSVMPVTLPFDIPPVVNEARSGVGTDLVVVPGTITWFKDPLRALRWIDRSPDLPRRVLFAGRVDESGCLDHVVRLARDLSIETSVRSVARAEMYDLLSTATATVLPSRLESLGFSLAEALVLCRGRVVASGLASHREIARRIGRQPSWDAETRPDPYQGERLASARRGATRHWSELRRGIEATRARRDR